jgi:RHS repeat-associated protein
LRLATDFAGATTRYRGYTAARKPTEVENALGHKTEITYNASGLPIRIINALDQRAFVTYDSWGNPTVLTDTLGHAYTFTYDGPNLTLVETAAGQQIALGYQDQAGWRQMLSSIVHSGSLTTTLEYNAPGDLTTITDALGRETSLNYDAAGRPTTIVDPLGITTTLDYDANDRVYRTIQSAREDGPVGDLLQRTTVLTYNALGNITSITDPLSRTISYQYDPAGRLTHQILPDSRVITFTYDVQQRQMTLTPPGRPEHSFTFSPMDLVEDYLPPQIGLGDQDTTATYDLLQQLTGLERPDGSSLAFGYDPIGRTTAITSTQGVLQAIYDPANGELQTLTTPDGGTLSYAYDADGRLTTLTWGGTLTGTVQLTPTLQGQLAAQHVNSAPSISFAYDPAGMLTQAGDLAIASDPARGHLIGGTLGVITDTWGYNAFNEPRQYQAAISDTAALTFQYQRDATSRITSKTETISDTTSVYSYTYDLAGQLTEVWQDGTRTAEYTYDSNGNRLSISRHGGTTTGSYNAQDQLLQYGTSIYTYTLNGELASETSGGQTTSYSYDAFGNLTGVVLPDDTAITYMLDGGGRRIGKKIDGTLVQGFLYQDALRPIAELDSAGNVVSQFVYATRSNVPDYLAKDGRTYRILADQLGSPRLVVDAQTGQVAQRLDYNVFGAIILDTNPGFQPFGFAGGLYDQETQLTHFGAREYDAETGRWTSKDPLLFGGGDTNLYRYAGNDPVNFIDPSGHLAHIVLVSLAMGAFGALMGAGGALLSQMILQGICKQSNPIDWTAVGWGALSGGLAGLFYPFASQFKYGHVLLGAAASTLQYHFSTSSTERSLGGYLTAGSTGGIAGWLGGRYSPATGLRAGSTNRSWRTELGRVRADVAANTNGWPFIRAGTGNAAGNILGAFLGGDICNCK